MFGSGHSNMAGPYCRKALSRESWNQVSEVNTAAIVPTGESVIGDMPRTAFMLKSDTKAEITAEHNQRTLWGRVYLTKPMANRRCPYCTEEMKSRCTFGQGCVCEKVGRLNFVIINDLGMSATKVGMFASEEGNVSCIDPFIKHKADVAQVDGDGWTALMLASFNGHIFCVDSLVSLLFAFYCWPQSRCGPAIGDGWTRTPQREHKVTLLGCRLPGRGCDLPAPPARKKRTIH